jgi:crotonobetainyl-CoA:carnitine CoA-transferase CaiB-like acyl-CoA transferase
MPGPLDGVRILDLSRVLAGPSCTQLLGDLGAEIVKVERPGVGDETRTWGPPFVKDEDGKETTESGYFLSTNRNKRSVTIDFAKPEGAALVRRLLARCDVIHNQMDKARFNRAADWRAAPRAPLGQGLSRDGMTGIALPKLGPGEF